MKNPGSEMSNLPATTAAPWPSRGVPAVITGSWEGARRWRDATIAMERGKLFCQVMLGFELLAIRKAAGIRQGGDRKTQAGKSNSNSENLIWEEALAKEVGLSKATAYRIMGIAEAAAPRLRRLPALRGFDPTAQAASALPEGMQADLDAAVVKLTDGLTQSEFMQELGIAKAPQGSGATGRKPGEGGRRAVSPSEAVEVQRASARVEWLQIERDLLEKAELKFRLLPDPEIQAQVSALERALANRKEWLREKPEKRDHAAVLSAVQSLL